MGVAPNNTGASAEATNVKEETKTASPGLTSQAIKANVKASVPEPQVEQFLTLE